MAFKRIDLLFALEREINSLMPQERLRVRKSEAVLWSMNCEQCSKPSKDSNTTKAINSITVSTAGRHSCAPSMMAAFGIYSASIGRRRP